MSLPVLVALVVVGIALSVLAVHFTGGSKIATLADAIRRSAVSPMIFPTRRWRRCA